MTRALGFALVQFLWQGAAVWLATCAVLIALRRASSNARYAAGVVGLAAMLALPIVTFGNHFGDASRVGVTADQDSPTAYPETAASPVAPEPTPILEAARRANSSPSEWLEPRLPYVAAAWAACVLLLAGQLLRGWWRVTRIRRQATPVASGADHWNQTLKDLADRVGVTRTLTLLQSALVDAPAVIGLVRPAIIVPVSAFAGLPPAHLEAILAHELAHIRRSDYLVNMLQCVIETLLFYHPAVWWVSKQVRIERENCCDDVAAGVCADRVAYARALASLEELRVATPRLALAADGGDLLTRIRRLVEPAAVAGPRFSGGFAMTVILTALLFAIGTEMNGAAPQAAPPPPPAAPASVAQAVAPPLPPPPPPPAQSATPPQVVPATAPPPPQQPPPPTLVLRQGWLLTGYGANARLTMTVRANGEVTRVVSSVRPADSSSLVFDQAKQAFERGDYEDAEVLTNRALQLIRSASRSMPPPPPAPPPPAVNSVSGTVRHRLPLDFNVFAHSIKTVVNPVYPPAAIAGNIEGDVDIEVTIAADGAVANARALTGHAMLQEAALKAVRQWTFAPTLVGGKPVEKTGTITIKFAK